MAELLTIINADSWDDFDGPHEVFAELLDGLDRTDRSVMQARADNLTRDTDGTYVVRTVSEVEARRNA